MDGLKGLVPRRILPVLLILAGLAGLIVQSYQAQQASRYALTAAVVDQGSVHLEEYEDVLGVDRAVYEGRLYSDKAPGQPLFAVPFYAVGRWLGIEPATELRIEGNLGLWWVSLWSSLIPVLVLAVLIYRRSERVVPQYAVVATATILFGTLLLPFSSLLFGHVMAATLLYLSFYVASSDSGRFALFWSGLAAGLSVVVEYTALLGVLVITVYLAASQWRRVWQFLAGGGVAAIALLAYNAVAFGDLFVLSYQYTAFSETTDTARPLLAMFSAASLENLRRLLLDGRGLVIATPVVLVAVAGAVSRLRRGKQADAIVGLAMFGVFLLLPIFWGNPWGGDSPGPRYMIPAFPFLSVPLAWAWGRWPVLARGAAVISVGTMVLATNTDPIVSRFASGGIDIWAYQALNGSLAETLLTMAVGPWGWTLQAAMLLGLAIYAVSSARETGK